jgi:hypothetical protein
MTGAHVDGMAMTVLMDPERAVLQSVREIRLQVSVVRVLLDEVESTEPAFREVARAHFVEELARLGCRILEVASKLATTPDDPTSG